MQMRRKTITYPTLPSLSFGRPCLRSVPEATEWAIEVLKKWEPGYRSLWFPIIWPSPPVFVDSPSEADLLPTVYSDGSFKHGCAGAGAWHEKMGGTKAFFSHRATIFDAELLGVALALDLCVGEASPVLGIDNESVISLLCSNQAPDMRMVSEVWMAARGRTVHLKKVKVHSNNRGNDNADVRAKRAVQVGVAKELKGILTLEGVQMRTKRWTTVRRPWVHNRKVKKAKVPMWAFGAMKAISWCWANPGPWKRTKEGSDANAGFGLMGITCYSIAGILGPPAHARAPTDLLHLLATQRHLKWDALAAISESKALKILKYITELVR
jgi:ribonuclease HI